MSAYSNLAGLYPPNENQTFNESILWQPIPVHTRPMNEDNVSSAWVECQGPHHTKDVINGTSSSLV